MWLPDHMSSWAALPHDQITLEIDHIDNTFANFILAPSATIEWDMYEEFDAFLQSSSLFLLIPRLNVG